MIPLVLLGVLALVLVSMSGPRERTHVVPSVPPPPPAPGTTVLYTDEILEAQRRQSASRRAETDRLFSEAEAALIENQTELDMLQEDIRRMR